MPGAESCNYFFAFVACLISSTVLALTLVSYAALLTRFCNNQNFDADVHVLIAKQS
jgi:hypothetical protein